MSGGFIKKFRISILLFFLFALAAGEWLSRARSTDWNDSLWVAVYPINGDGSQAAKKYINALDEDNFNDIEVFMQGEIKKFKSGKNNPVTLKLAPEVKVKPPFPPAHGNTLSIIFWSLQMRYWAWKHDNYSSPKDIKVFVLYYDPETNQRLAHSIGLQKGLLGVVNAFASKEMHASNNVVIAHEMLHTLGATDKYDLSTGLPIHPYGYAEPYRDPLYPQRQAEIMGGKIAVSETKVKMPKSLKSVIVGNATAREIRWQE